MTNGCRCWSPPQPASNVHKCLLTHETGNTKQTVYMAPWPRCSMHSGLMLPQFLLRACTHRQWVYCATRVRRCAHIHNFMQRSIMRSPQDERSPKHHQLPSNITKQAVQTNQITSIKQPMPARALRFAIAERRHGASYMDLLKGKGRSGSASAPAQANNIPGRPA